MEKMYSVGKKDIKNSLLDLGIEEGDMVLFHSSLKSFGNVDGGADAVIDAFLEVVGNSGTVIVPTFSQKNFSEAYNTWHMDKTSDTGYITEVFRKREGALRSNQATHSVAAIGRNAQYIVQDHGKSGERHGIYGSTPFARESPWQKMYDENVKVVLVGVGLESFTFKHLWEYMLVERALENAKLRNEYDEYFKYICCFEERDRRCDTYFWPYIRKEPLERFVSENKLYSKVACGEAIMKRLNAKTLGEAVMENIWSDPEKWYTGTILKWFLDNVTDK